MDLGPDPSYTAVTERDTGDKEFHMAQGFARRLKVARQEAGLSQRELATGICSTSLLSRLEAGTRQPSVDTVRDLASRLGVTPSDLTGEADQVTLRPRTGDRFEHIERLIHARDFPRAVDLASQILRRPADSHRRARALHLRARAYLGMGLLAIASADLQSAARLAHHHQHTTLAVQIWLELARIRRDQTAG